MGLALDALEYFPGGRLRQGINYNAQGIPYGTDVVWRLCDHCGGEGIDYYDAENARECPKCQGIGKLPYERRGGGAFRQQGEPWTCAEGHENPGYVVKGCRVAGCRERRAA